ncbi:hypothetical protein AAG747_07755 [Rapidithrix thailandica]|uniref:Uncharacterized protein n=1 Tax=Rapidithrix thailandica TaxID=413964 RepID=A0AAW9S5V9_9BACT
MKEQISLFFGILFAFSCNHLKQNDKKNDIENQLIVKEVIEENQNIYRCLSEVLFDDSTSLDVVCNFYTQRKIDSISVQKKSVRGRYLHCGKGRVNMRLFNLLKTSNFKEYNELEKIHTAHNIIIKSDILYLSGREHLKCLEENDSVLIKSTIYTFHQQGLKTNLMIVDELLKIE